MFGAETHASLKKISRRAATGRSQFDDVCVDRTLITERVLTQTHVRQAIADRVIVRERVFGILIEVIRARVIPLIQNAQCSIAELRFGAEFSSRSLV